jgi:hypothetical protein
MKKILLKGFVYFDGVKTGFNEEAVKGMSLTEFKKTFQGKIRYSNQAKELQPELPKIYEAIVGKKKPVRRKKASK